jgi:hypothetical protein
VAAARADRDARICNRMCEGPKHGRAGIDAEAKRPEPPRRLGLKIARLSRSRRRPGTRATAKFTPRSTSLSAHRAGAERPRYHDVRSTKSRAFYSKPDKDRVPVGRLYLDIESPPGTAAVQDQVQKAVHYRKLFKNLGIQSMQEDMITFGQARPNPLVDWERADVRLPLYQPDAVELPQPLIDAEGLLHSGPGEVQRPAIYRLRGRHLQQRELPCDGIHQHQARNGSCVDLPVRAKWKFDGLRITAFYEYGYGNVTADTFRQQQWTGNSAAVQPRPRRICRG